MPNEPEPREKPADTQSDSEPSPTISLVDYFDQIDRDAFRRALEARAALRERVPHD